METINEHIESDFVDELLDIHSINNNCNEYTCNKKKITNGENFGKYISELLIDKLIIRDSIFESNININGIENERNSISPWIIFDRCTFEKTVSFKYSLFKGKCGFVNCIFEEDFSLRICEISNLVYFSACKFKKEIKIWDCNFSNSLKINECKISSINIQNTSIENMFSLSNSNIEDIFINDLDVNGSKIQMNGVDFHIRTKDRFTARLLKEQAIIAHNIILYNNLKSQEMNLYWKELKKWKYIVGIKSFFSWLGEFILLGLNTLSNKNGLSWLRGIIFTLGVWFIFFSWFIVARDGWGDVFIWSDERYIGQSINYFWLFSGLDGIKGQSMSWGEVIPFLLGKIFIGYGIYQTISAFRKYGGK